jgi:hypothetical protein
MPWFRHCSSQYKNLTPKLCTQGAYLQPIIHRLSSRRKKKTADWEQNATATYLSSSHTVSAVAALYLALQVRLPAGGPRRRRLGASLGRLLRRRQRGARAADGAGGARAEPGVDAGGVERVPAPGERAHRVPVLHGAQAHRALHGLAAGRGRLESEHRHGRQRRLVKPGGGPLPRGQPRAGVRPVHAVAAAPAHVQVVHVQDHPVQHQAHRRERAHQLQRRAGGAAPAAARRRRRRRPGRVHRGHAAAWSVVS